METKTACYRVRRDSFIVTAYDDRGREVSSHDIEQDIADSRNCAYAIARGIKADDPSLIVWVCDTAKNTRTRIRSELFC